jgi:hypothetical protein
MVDHNPGGGHLLGTGLSPQVVDIFIYTSNRLTSCNLLPSYLICGIFRSEAVTVAYDLITLINPISLFHMEAVVAVLVIMVASMIILVLQAAMEAMVS